MRSKLIKRLVLLTLALGVLVGLIYVIGRQDLWHTLAQIDGMGMVYLGMFQLLTLAATAKAWHWLLQRQGGACRFRVVFACQLAGQWVESLTPASKLGGEAARVVLIKPYSTLSYSQLTASMLISKLLSLIPFLLICLGLLGLTLWYWQPPWLVYPSIAGLFLVVLALGAFVLWPRSAVQLANTLGLAETSRTRLALQKISQVAWQSRELVAGHGFPWPPMLLSTFVWLGYPLKVALAAWALGLPTPWLLLSLGIFVGYLISMLPLLPGGLGSFEASMTLILTLGGFAPAEALAITLTTRVFTYWLPLALSGIAVLYLVLPQRWSLHDKSIQSS